VRWLAVTTALLALAAPAAAQQQRAQLSDIADEVMCVSCHIPLFIAESPQADRERAFITGLIDQGLTKDQIKRRLVAEYGEDVLAVPEDDGTSGVAAKVIPVAAVVLLVGLAALLLPRWRRRTGTTPLAAGAGPPVTEAELERLDEDLKRRA
jgi:cytochrome c-type biogenesis protein CcmH